ncbi:Sterol regulatory element-binding protein cleavage-activating protein [Halotydeus destructor]|nr:Sterol regulatory element-binding protein cleavage-activating protein [Halotydeus destructor]
MESDSDSSLIQSVDSSDYRRTRRREKPIRKPHLICYILGRLRDKIATLYYRQALTPQTWIVLFISLLIFAICSYPYLHIHLIRSASQHFVTKLKNDQSSSDSNGGNLIDDNDENDDEATRWTNGEILALVGLLIPILSLKCYLFYTLYRCCCTRRYAEWRTMWSEKIRGEHGHHKHGSYSYNDSVTEAIPQKLHGHEQDIELVACNDESPFVATICMKGDILIWDVLTGECLTQIKRNFTKVSDRNTFKPTHKQTGSFSSDSTYGSSPGNCGPDMQIEQSSPIAASTSELRTHSSAGAPLVSSSIKKIKHKRQVSLPVMPAIHNNGDDHKKPFNFSSHYARMNTNNTVITELIRSAMADESRDGNIQVLANRIIESPLSFLPIWSTDLLDRWLFCGTGNNRMEIWNVLNGQLIYSQESVNGNNGVGAVKVSSSLLILAYMNGVVEFYSVNRSGSSLQVVLQQAVRAHQQPITALAMDYNHVITGSLDHQLKVYRTDNFSPVYTLRGHCGGITVIQSDSSNAAMAISGCAVGLVMVWDLSTGTCVFSLEAHQGFSVTALLATPLFIISTATDDKICIWDKYSGNLVNTILRHQSMAKKIVLLAPNFLITAKDDQLVVWDMVKGVPLRHVDLGSTSRTDCQSYIKGLRTCSQSRVVVCDCGPQLCLVHFPNIAEKCD